MSSIYFFYAEKDAEVSAIHDSSFFTLPLVWIMTVHNPKGSPVSVTKCHEQGQPRPDSSNNAQHPAGVLESKYSSKSL